MRPPLDLSCSLGVWTNQRHQPFLEIEPKVRVAPSNVDGLGVYTTCTIVEGDVVCLFSGVLRKSISGIRSRYILECFWYNHKTMEREKLYIDSTHWCNTAGRYINDACDYTEREWSDMSPSIKTPYDTNVGFKQMCSRYVHPVVKVHTVEVVALCDIEPHTELFTRYGTDYWKNWYSDVDFLVGDKYGQYFENN